MLVFYLYLFLAFYLAVFIFFGSFNVHNVSVHYYTNKFMPYNLEITTHLLEGVLKDVLLIRVLDLNGFKLCWVRAFWRRENREGSLGVCTPFL